MIATDIQTPSVKSKKKHTKEKAELFVKRLVTEGATTPCDNSVDSFTNNENVPPFYDEALFKQGQAFFQKHICSMFLGKLLGLMATLSTPTALQILKHTKMSGSNFTAYRRYMATSFHTIIWYDSDLSPDSKLWESIRKVRNIHNSTSNKAFKAGIHRIIQKDMVLAQFGFVGIILTKGTSIGIHNATEEEWKGLIHVWRVLGHLLGIEDRFNLCQGTVEETKAKCNAIIKQVCLPTIAEQTPEAIQMCKYMISGFRCLMVFLNYNTLQCFLMSILDERDYNGEIHEDVNLTFGEKILFSLLVGIIYLLKWRFFRWIFNSELRIGIWMMKHYPIIAYLRFGYKRSHVQI